MHIIARIEKLRHREHHATVDLIEALLECKRTGAHLSAGYPSIFMFLANHLKYSKAAASRRWKATKCAERHPQVLEMLREHRINLSVLATSEATLAKASDPDAFLAEIDGQSSADVERRLAARNPVRPRQEQIRREYEVEDKGAGTAKADGNGDLFGDNGGASGASRGGENRAGAEPGKPAGSPARHDAVTETDVSPGDASAGVDATARAYTSADADTKSGADTNASADAGPDTTRASAEDSSTKPPVTRERIRITFSLDPADYKKLEEAMVILNRKIPAKLTLETTMQELLQFFLERKRPKPERPHKAPRGRHIPKALRDKVMIRDQGRCQFVGRGGRKCHSQHNLQIDHIQPVSKGGRTKLENLRVLCAAHNRHRVRVSERNRVQNQHAAARNQAMLSGA